MGVGGGCGGGGGGVGWGGGGWGGGGGGVGVGVGVGGGGWGGYWGFTSVEANKEFPHARLVDFQGSNEKISRANKCYVLIVFLGEKRMILAA